MGPSVTATGGTSSSALNAAVVAAAQQHTAVHNHQATNTQASALGHTGWSPAVGALAAQGHQTVVTDHSTLAYMSHAYQTTNSSVNDHRTASGPMTHQSIGTAPQASSYAVDSLYNSPAAAAAAAAYGYNNYNAAFFQTSNNGPQASSLSAFWPSQNTQQRTNHSQGVSSQASLQQRQQMPAEQVSNYMQDPRVYYGRPPYGQVMQNFSQHQPHSTHHHQHQQSELTHNRQSTLAQQQMLMHHEHQLQQFDSHQHLTSQQPQHSLQEASTINDISTHPDQQNNLGEQARPDQTVVSSQNQGKRAQSPRVSPQSSIQKVPSADIDKSSSLKLDYDQMTTNKTSQSNTVIQRDSQQPATKDIDSSNLHGTQSNNLKDTNKLPPANSLPPVNKSQSVIKSEPGVQYQNQTQTRKSNANNNTQQQSRNVYRSSHDERTAKSQPAELPKKQVGEVEQRSSTSKETKEAQPHQAINKTQEPERSAIEDSLATLAISSRKTTWASIASQPAKVAQPKSLKSKIAGSNSVLSSAKHLASSVTLDSSSLESKNGINPAIKNSVSIAATSLPRGSKPIPVSQIASAAVANLKLDLLGDENTETSKISWPAVNASMSLTLDDPPSKKENSTAGSVSNANQDRQKKDDDAKRDQRDAGPKDHNHNQGGDARMVNNYQYSQTPREERRDELWSNRREPRDYRTRRESDRKEVVEDKRMNHDDMRNQPNSRRDFKASSRSNHFRNDEPGFRDRDRDRDRERDRERERDHKRGAILDRNDHRGNDNYRFPPNRYENHREPSHQNIPPPPPQQHGNRQNENAPHHHYNNLRDGNSARGVQNKLDLSLHPHLNPANYNPKNFNCEPENARYFIIKSYSEDDIHRSIKYSIWCSTNHGNKRLDEAYRQQQAKNGQLFLFFSVNGSGHFCGIAQMTSAVDFDSSSGVWAQSKWQGEFSVKWIYVKDVPNSALRHIKLENNEDKPVTNSRDTQEVPSEKGKAVLKIIHQYPHETSLFDDFLHYERRQEEEKLKKSQSEQQSAGRPEDKERGRFNRPYTNPRIHNEFRDRPGSRDRPSRYLS
jgi:hypothetical protein